MANASLLLNQSAWTYPYENYSVLYLENTTAGHRKFYTMTNDGGGKWIASWGKIGTSGQKMTYEKSLWHDKLKEKLSKGYILESVVASSGAKPKGTPPPVINIKSPDVPLDPNVLAKLDRIIYFLDEKKNELDASKATVIRENYARTGKLTKHSMEILNSLWKRNGGGAW